MPTRFEALRSLGALRLALALVVVGGHTPQYPETWPDISGIAVSVFFFVSGFLMPLAFESNYHSRAFWDQTLRFWLNRFLKIYPWFWLSISMPLALVIFRGVRNESEQHFFVPSVFFQNALLLGLNQVEIWGHYVRYNNPAWTLDVELQYYLLVPALVWAYDRWPRFLTSLLVVAAVPSLYLIANPTGFIGLDRSLLAWSALFFAGFLYFKALSKGDPARRPNGVADHNVACVLGVHIAMLLLESTRIPAIVTGFFFSAAYLLKVEISGEKRKAGKFLGDLSYPVYIFHFFLIGPAQARSTPFFEGAGLSGTALYFAILLVNVLVCLVFSSAVVVFGNPLIERVRSRLRTHERSHTLSNVRN